MASGDIIITDLFTGSGTLDSHTPDYEAYGHGWDADANFLTNGTAYNNSTGVVEAYCTDALDDPDVVVTTSVHGPGTGGSSQYFDIVIRGEYGPTTGYIARLLQTGINTAKIQILDRNDSSVLSESASIATGVTNYYDFVFSVIGNSLEASYHGTSTSTTDSSYTSAGYTGIAINRSSAGFQSFAATNFEAQYDSYFIPAIQKSVLTSSASINSVGVIPFPIESALTSSGVIKAVGTESTIHIAAALESTNVATSPGYGFGYKVSTLVSTGAISSTTQELRTYVETLVSESLRVERPYINELLVEISASLASSGELEDIEITYYWNDAIVGNWQSFSHRIATLGLLKRSTLSYATEGLYNWVSIAAKIAGPLISYGHIKPVKFGHYKPPFCNLPHYKWDGIKRTRNRHASRYMYHRGKPKR